MDLFNFKVLIFLHPVSNVVKELHSILYKIEQGPRIFKYGCPVFICCACEFVFFLPGLLKLCKEERKKLVEAGGTSKKPVGRRSSVKKSASQRLSRSRTRINRSQSGKSLSYIGLFGNSPNQLSYKWI